MPPRERVSLELRKPSTRSAGDVPAAAPPDPGLPTQVTIQQFIASEVTPSCREPAAPIPITTALAPGPATVAQCSAQHVVVPVILPDESQAEAIGAEPESFTPPAAALVVALDPPAVAVAPTLAALPHEPLTPDCPAVAEEHTANAPEVYVPPSRPVVNSQQMSFRQNGCGADFLPGEDLDVSVVLNRSEDQPARISTRVTLTAFNVSRRSYIRLAFASERTELGSIHLGPHNKAALVSLIETESGRTTRRPLFISSTLPVLGHSITGEICFSELTRAAVSGHYSLRCSNGAGQIRDIDGCFEAIPRLARAPLATTRSAIQAARL